MKLKIKNIHIAIIIAGILFNCISVFHSNLWFDESYSVGLASWSLIDIWKIGGNDVHPILYYWILHIIYQLTNGSIIAYRIFSWICISMLGILGFTHIRKDFGEKTGAIFSFFSYFLPVICIYSAEIRMYSLAILLVSILAIYAHRLIKQENDTFKNWMIFGVTSLMCIYTHYYGLMAAGIINLVLLGILIKQKRNKSAIKLVAMGVIQLVAYIPWILYFVQQLKNVSKGFWIGFEFPKTLYQLLSSQFSGNIAEKTGFIISLFIYAYLGYKVYKTIKNKEDYKVGVASLLIYLSVVVAAILVTIVMKTSILYYRYLFVITGLYIFFISYFLGKEKNKYIIGAICIVTLGLGITSNYMQIKEAYGPNNMTQITYLKENVQENDVIVFDESNFGTGSVVSLNFKDHKQFYYNPSNWGVEAAYRAFGDQLKIYTNDSFLNECKGRVWIIDGENEGLYNSLFNNENYHIVSKKLIKTEYEKYVYNMILVEYNY